MALIKREGGIAQAFKFVPLGGVFATGDVDHVFICAFVVDSNCGVNVFTGRLYSPADDDLVVYYPRATIALQGL